MCIAGHKATNSRHMYVHVQVLSDLVTVHMYNVIGNVLSHTACTILSTVSLHKISTIT